MNRLTEVQERMLRQVALRPKSASNLGAALWPVTKGGATNRKPQSFARPAGKVLKQLENLLLVTQFYCSDDPRSLWKLTHEGRKYLASL